MYAIKMLTEVVDRAPSISTTVPRVISRTRQVLRVEFPTLARASPTYDSQTERHLPTRKQWTFSFLLATNFRSFGCETFVQVVNMQAVWELNHICAVYGGFVLGGLSDDEEALIRLHLKSQL